MSIIPFTVAVLIIVLFAYHINWLRHYLKDNYSDDREYYATRKKQRLLRYLVGVTQNSKVNFEADYSNIDVNILNAFIR